MNSSLRIPPPPPPPSPPVPQDNKAPLRPLRVVFLSLLCCVSLSSLPRFASPKRTHSHTAHTHRVTCCVNHACCMALHVLHCCSHAREVKGSSPVIALANTSPVLSPLNPRSGWLRCSDAVGQAAVLPTITGGAGMLLVCLLYASPCAPLLIPWLEEVKGISLAMTKAKASPVTAHTSLCSAVQVGICPTTVGRTADGTADQWHPHLSTGGTLNMGN